ncbi:MAG TPA: histidine phosphatase family protein, partial [Candidatus Sulfotelmatobacter sp.]|nr:histidine phosphatase family protein [Candidatus Sulfotelmatobacter sp.]
NLTGIMGGDSGLTNDGEKQALALGKKFKNIDFAAVFSSAKKRAIQTAQLIIKGKDLEVKKHEDLRERSFGSLDKERNKEYMHLFNALNDMSDDEVWNWKIVEDMESALEAVDRFSKVLQEIGKAYIGKKVLIVSHGTVNRSFLVKIGYGSFKNLGNGSFSNTGYAVLKYDGKNFSVEEINGINYKN